MFDSIVLFSAHSLDYALVAHQSHCTGTDTKKGDMDSIEDCASACRGEFQLFTFGLDTAGNSRCGSNGKCQCWCEAETEDFKCKTQEVHTGYNLYAFKGK